MTYQEENVLKNTITWRSVSEVNVNWMVTVW